MFSMGADNYKLQVKEDYVTGKIETLPLHNKLNVPLFTQNVRMVYENYARGKYVPSFNERRCSTS